MLVETSFIGTLGEELGSRTEAGLVVELPWGAGLFKWGVLQGILHPPCDTLHLALQPSSDLVTLQFPNFKLMTHAYVYLGTGYGLLVWYLSSENLSV